MKHKNVESKPIDIHMQMQNMAKIGSTQEAILQRAKMTLFFPSSFK